MSSDFENNSILYNKAGSKTKNAISGRIAKLIVMIVFID
jgi:hypothetical protein